MFCSSLCIFFWGEIYCNVWFIFICSITSFAGCFLHFLFTSGCDQFDYNLPWCGFIHVSCAGVHWYSWFCEFIVMSNLKNLWPLFLQIYLSFSASPLKISITLMLDSSWSPNDHGSTYGLLTWGYSAKVIRIQ